ncbi:hypothetical protein [Herbidospora mongoliensis]|uniref:hypothetical protein n=1 Tax=Herbidospora mongoliensis TaxID=688067 RepID=UPI000829B109|nr:hypothetical protein [Herbidospora mongoliensis]
MTATRINAPGPWDLAVLADAMLMLVPFWMAEMVDRTPEQLTAIASRAAAEFGTRGDQILFAGQTTGQKLSPAA